MEKIFWFSLIFVIYTYFGYPLLLSLISFFKKTVTIKGDYTPYVTFIITAYNEEKRIESKIENTLLQDYPRDKLEIIVASDCSSDSTDNIVRNYKQKGIKLSRTPTRKGKENAQKHAINIAKGEVIVFSDVATILDTNAITNIVSNFSDATVGCVSSVDKFINQDGNISGESAYVKYEMFLRNLESKIGTIIGLSGSFFAARREICSPWETDIPSDFNTLLNAIKKGYRGVSDNESVGYYHDIADKTKEFNRKIRTVVRGIRVLMKNASALNPFKYGFLSFQLLNHKLFRWLVPFAMIVVLVSNFAILNDELYYVILLCQFFFYLTAIVGITTQSKLNIIKLPSFFVLVNISILVAWYKYIRGENYITWKPSVR